MHIVVCSEAEKSELFYAEKGKKLYAIQNCAAAIQNMLLAAHAEGLGSCWVGAFDEDMLKDALKIPDEVYPQAVVTIGCIA